jgi:hypothetical protein
MAEIRGNGKGRLRGIANALISDPQSVDAMDGGWDKISPIRSPLARGLYAIAIAFLLLLEHRYLGLLRWVLFPLAGLILFTTFNDRMFDAYLFRSQGEDEAACQHACIRKSTMYSEWGTSLTYRLTLVALLILTPSGYDLYIPWGAVAANLAYTAYSHYAIFRPIAVVFFGNTNESSLSLLSEIQIAVGHYRVVSLLRIRADEALAWKKPIRHTTRLRFRREYENDWKVSVEQLIRVARFVVVDARAATPLVVYEAALALAPDMRRKALIVSDAEGNLPVLDEVLAADPTISVPESQIVAEGDVRERVKALVNDLMESAKVEWASPPR